jgi:hypothetical protein
MKMNKSHYSFIAKIMPRHITEVVQRRGTRLYYNPMVKFPNCNKRIYKYGVMHKDDFIHDLTHWREFFVSARLQKPVLEVINEVGCFKRMKMSC